MVRASLPHLTSGLAEFFASQKRKLPRQSSPSSSSSSTAPLTRRAKLRRIATKYGLLLAEDAVKELRQHYDKEYSNQTGGGSFHALKSPYITMSDSMNANGTMATRRVKRQKKTGGRRRRSKGRRVIKRRRPARKRHSTKRHVGRRGRRKLPSTLSARDIFG